MSEDNKNQSRRDFLKIGAAAGLGAAVAGLGLEAKPSGPSGESRSQFRAPAIPTVKVGFVGVGGMGSAHVQNYLNIEGLEVKAICDIRPAHVERAQKWVVEAGQPKPTGYSNGPRDFEKMCEKEDLDLVMTRSRSSFSHIFSKSRGPFEYPVGFGCPASTTHFWARST